MKALAKFCLPLLLAAHATPSMANAVVVLKTPEVAPAKTTKVIDKWNSETGVSEKITLSTFSRLAIPRGSIDMPIAKGTFPEGQSKRICMNPKSWHFLKTENGRSLEFNFESPEAKAEFEKNERLLWADPNNIIRASEYKVSPNDYRDPPKFHPQSDQSIECDYLPSRVFEYYGLSEGVFYPDEETEICISFESNQDALTFKKTVLSDANLAIVVNAPEWRDLTPNNVQLRARLGNDTQHITLQQALSDSAKLAELSQAAKP